MANVVVLLALGLALFGVFALAVLAGQWVYQAIRGKDARPLTDEEKWQETSMESMSEEEWSALLASLEDEESTDTSR